MSVKPAPILLTWDVDPDRWATSEDRARALTLALDACDAVGARATFFITAEYAHEYPALLERMRRSGHEVGCHGWLHSDEEDYDRMPEALQREYIHTATQKLEAAAGASPLSFRSPRVKTSAQTLRLLCEHGYRVDSSVCSQRVDLISSNLINPGWVTAPRRPYHPHAGSAFRRGDLPILETPVSALALPFISSTLKVGGLGMMKVFFRLLWAEARATGKPIVYLAHPSEFVVSTPRRMRITRRDFSLQRIRTHGLQARSLLYRFEGQALLAATQALFAWMAASPGAIFMTCAEYAEQHAASLV